MLTFQKAIDRRLRAVTHGDGSARVQTVRPNDNARLYDLLGAFHLATDVGVLCNTSLNVHGHGFLNRLSDLLFFAEREGIENVVVEDVWYSWSGR